MTTFFDASFSHLDYEAEKISCGALYFTQTKEVGGSRLSLDVKTFRLFFNGLMDVTIRIRPQNIIVGNILELLNKKTTKDEILRLYNISHGTTPETYKETINYTIANLNDFKYALKRCDVLNTSHIPGNNLQFIFNF